MLKVKELRGFFPSTDHPVPTYLEYYSIDRKHSFTNNGSASLDTACNCSMEKGDSDTTLHLGYAIVLILPTLWLIYIHSLLFIVVLGDFEFCKYFIEVFISIMHN